MNKPNKKISTFIHFRKPKADRNADPKVTSNAGISRGSGIGMMTKM
jgi:hypothetical protein